MSRTHTGTLDNFQSRESNPLSRLRGQGWLRNISWSKKIRGVISNSISFLFIHYYFGCSIKIPVQPILSVSTKNALYFIFIDCDLKLKEPWYRHFYSFTYFAKYNPSKLATSVSALCLILFLCVIQIIFYCFSIYSVF